MLLPLHLLSCAPGPGTDCPCLGIVEELDAYGWMAACFSAISKHGPSLPVTLGRVPQLMGVEPSALLFLTRLILLWGLGMEVGPYRVGPPSVSCDPGKGLYYSYYC